LVAVVVSVLPAAADTQARTTTRVSVDTAGGDPDGESLEPAISSTGRYIAFTSYASDLVPGDDHGLGDVFVRDVVADTTTRVSVSATGGDPNGRSMMPAISADGRYIAFTSYAFNLVPGDGRGFGDLFVRDMAAGGTTARVSVDTTGGNPDGDSFEPAISATGRYIAFTSVASDLVPKDRNLDADVFVRDVVAGTTARVSVDTTGRGPNGDSYEPAISATGRYIAFHSAASDLVPGDGNRCEDVFVRDLVAGTTTRVSVDTTGGDPDSRSYSPAISADGRYIAFQSSASDLVPGDGNGAYDVFVRDMVAGTTTRVSVDTAGGDDAYLDPAISADGRYIAFQSPASDLAPRYDVFVRDMVAGTTTRVSVDTAGGDPNRDSDHPVISADGRYIAFRSFASDLVPGDGNGFRDVFLRGPAGTAPL
jgi:Tol biopolymer transport system component